MNPDLQQNLFITLYLVILHNFFALIYIAGLIVSTAYSLYRPSRKATLFMIGFALLLFSFEYSKHIVEGLKEQTVNSLITETPRYHLERLITVTISKLLPLFLNIGGGLSLIIASYSVFKDIKSNIKN